MKKYTYETDDEAIMNLIVNIDKVKLTLEKFKDCYRKIYNGKDYRANKKYYYKGKIYTEKELSEEKIETDEEGLFGCMPIYTEEELLTMINDYLQPIWNLID